MRLSIVFASLFLASVTTAFAPTTIHPATRSALFVPQKASVIADPPEAVRDVSDNVVSKIQSVLEKADDLVLSRAMRFVNHAPVIVTLGSILKQLGSTKYGFDIAPSALSIASPSGLAVPTWVGYALPVLVVSQVASVLRSSLSADGDELTQDDISALAVSNFALCRALANPSPLNWGIAAVASGYYARNGHGDEDANIGNLSIQITSSLASVATVLGVASRLPQVIPFLQGQEQLTAVLGLCGYLGLSTRDGNSTVKKVVNASVMAGVLISQIAGGALQVSNLLRLDTVVTAATAYVAVLSVDKAREALAGNSGGSSD